MAPPSHNTEQLVANSAQEFAHDIFLPIPPFDIDDTDDDTARESRHWYFLAPKSGGANAAGQYAGFYRVNYPQQLTRTAYLKQDPEQDKNICEVFASQFMRFIAEEIGENPSTIANVNYVSMPNSEIYIVSDVFDGYRDLFLDAYLGYQLPVYENLRSLIGNKWQHLPTSRPQFLETNYCIENMMDAGRYIDIIPGFALRAIVDDPDLHFENIGAVPIQGSDANDIIPIIKNGNLTGDFLTLNPDVKTPVKLTVNIKGKTYYHFKSDQQYPDFKEACILHNNQCYLVPNINNTRAVNIDFGGALGDFRPFNPRKLDGKIHTSKLLNLIRYRPSRRGPPSYQNQLPQSLVNGAEFFKTLARFSVIDHLKIKEKINDEIMRAKQFYQYQPHVLLNFAKRIGVKIPKKAKKNIDDITTHIQQFLSDNFIARQEHAQILFLDHFCRLDRRTQNNLMNGYLPDVHHDDRKEVTMTEFFQLMKNKHPLLFNAFEQIEDFKLDITMPEIIKFNLISLQACLHSDICDAYFKNNLAHEAKRITNIIAQTQQLLTMFNQTNAILTNSANDNERQEAVNQFINCATHYKKNTINTSLGQKAVIAACSLVGALIGIIIGGTLGLATGAAIGGGLGCVVPVVGNIACAVAAGSMSGIVLAAKGAGLGTMIGMAIGSFLLGSPMMFASGKYARHLLFSRTDKSVATLANDLDNYLDKKKTVIFP